MSSKKTRFITAEKGTNIGLEAHFQILASCWRGKSPAWFAEIATEQCVQFRRGTNNQFFASDN